MNFEIIKIGKPKNEYATLASIYEKRVQRFIKCHNQIVKAKEGKNLHFEEGLLRQKRLTLVVFDQKGTPLSTDRLCQRLKDWFQCGSIQTVTFVIGGATGLSSEFIAAAHHKWSLSNCLFTSDLSWLILWEQLYRACSIINNLPYHNG